MQSSDNASGTPRSTVFDPSEARNKSSRKDGKSNAPGRAVKWSKTPDGTDPNASETTIKVDKRLECILPYLETLPDKVFGPMIMESASLILSSSIHLKHGKEKFLRQEENPYRIPRSAALNFKLIGSEAVQLLDDFKNAEQQVEDKLRESELFIKEQIMSVQKMEVKDRTAAVRKVFFEEMIKLTRIFVIYFKAKYQSRSTCTSDTDQTISYVLSKSIEKLVEPPRTIINEDDTTMDEDEPLKNESEAKRTLYNFLHLEPNDDILQLLQDQPLFTEYNKVELNKMSTTNEEQEATANDSKYQMKDLLRNIRSIFQKLIPTITSRLLANYTSHKDSQLAVAAASAAFQNLKRDKLSETTNEVMETEESVDSKTLQSLFDQHKKEMEQNIQSTMKNALRKNSSGGRKTPGTNARQSNGTGSRKRSGDKISNASNPPKRQRTKPNPPSKQKAKQNSNSRQTQQKKKTQERNGNGRNGQMRGRGINNQRRNQGGRGGGRGGHHNATTSRNGRK